MYFNGCGVGNVFYRYDPLTTDWLLTPDKGAIAVFANSFWSYQLSTEIFLEEFYKKLFKDDNTVDLTLGELHKEVNQGLSKLKFNPFVLSNIHQLILQGDPALHYFPLQKPDFTLNENALFITSLDPSKPIEQNEKVLVGVIIKNLGRFDTTIKAELKLKLTSAGGISTTGSITASSGDISAVNGVYTGDISSVNATFTGTVTADSVNFSGDIYADDGFFGFINA